MKSLYISFCAGIMLAAAGVSAEVRFDDCFGDNMVIQRELPARFRGTADPGEEVTLSFAGQTASTVADDNGDWKITLAPLKASKTPQELTVRGRDNTVTLKNVLIGEVWLCTGQSNMFYRVWDKDPKMRHKDSEEISAQADHPLIRLVMVTCGKTNNPERKSPMSWCPAVHDHVKPFSAVGYLFGVELFKALDVPIGLVRACVGGTMIEPWTCLEGFRSVPEGRKSAALLAGRTGGTPEFEANAEKFRRDHDAWYEKAKSELAKKRVPPPAPPVPPAFGAISGGMPGVYYNAMIYPLTGMTVRGAIWYQGENNRIWWPKYRWQLHALLNGWKQVFENPDFQFHLVQIAPFRYNKELPMGCAGIWRAQQQFADETGCGMAVINDCGNPEDVHPNDKRPVARRLALLALNRTYGKKDIVCDAPRVAKWRIEGGAFVLTFKDSSRWSTSDGGPVAGFEVAGIDGKYFKANAKIDGADIRVSAPEVSAPRYLRYLAHNRDCGNLRNEHGLVPATFRIAKPTTEEELKYLTGRDGLVYEYDLFSGVKPAVDNARRFAGRELLRLNYLFVLKTEDGKTKYVDIGLAPFTRFLDLVGVPGSKVKRNVAAVVKDIRVRTNAPELVPDYEANAGTIEFFFTNYGAENVRSVPLAHDKLFDAGDRPSRSNAPGYGCMQFFEWLGNPIFCFSNLRGGKNCDLGFGFNPDPDGNPDWTFSKSGKNYSSARLYVFGEFK